MFAGIDVRHWRRAPTPCQAEAAQQRYRFWLSLKSRLMPTQPGSLRGELCPLSDLSLIMALQKPSPAASIPHLISGLACAD